MDITNRIKETAKQKGVSIPMLEDQCGLGRNTIYKWDQSPPSVTKVEKVADLLDVSIDYLVKGRDHTGPVLSHQDKELLKWLHLLNEETQRDFLGQIRIYVKQHEEDWASNSDDARSSEAVVSGK